MPAPCLVPLGARPAAVRWRGGPPPSPRLARVGGARRPRLARSAYAAAASETAAHFFDAGDIEALSNRLASTSHLADVLTHQLEQAEQV